MRSKSGTIRRVTSEHKLTKLRAYSAIDFEHAGAGPLVGPVGRPCERPSYTDLLPTGPSETP